VNFFEYQEHARTNTRRLVVFFVIAVVLIVLSVTAVVGVLVAAGENHERRDRPVTIDAAWFAGHAGILLFAGGATLALIVFGSLGKTAALSGGGGTVARELGGVPIDPDERDPQKRRVRNVVEEMAIASGTPVPEVYLLENEMGINAFAAGFKPADAAVTVTRGTMERLTRDELQGVIAHEFSHIFNGDMRLNMRLIGVLHGILLIGLTGQILFRSMAYGRMFGGRRDKNSGGAAILALGLALVVIGFSGLFFGRLIKAAVSRQREFLADASAVQFTRNPPGIAGALKKIGGYAEGSRLHAPKTEEVSHMLFGSGSASLAGLFATHPPLVERIRRIDPSFDQELAARKFETAASGAVPEAAAGFASGGASGPPPLPVNAAALHGTIGNPGAGHVRYASRILGGLPDSLREATGRPGSAAALVAGLMLGSGQSDRTAQLKLVDGALGAEGAAAADRLGREAQALGAAYRLPLVNLAFGALRRLAPEQILGLQDLLQRLAAADGRLDFFEFILARMVQTHLVDRLQPGSSEGSAALTGRRAEALLLLSAVAAVGEQDPGRAAEALAAGARAAGVDGAGASPRLDLIGLDAALVRLDALKPRDKSRLVQGLVATIAFDGTVTLEEGELLRAVCDTLHVPMPPLGADTEPAVS